MANNHGGSGSKFVSVNLNKLYGQTSHHNYQSHSGSYGPGAGTNRARPGGGMVVLSRNNRPLQKAAPKLSVPPPLNLPSLRKEYEKIDSSGAGGGVAGGAGSGSGSRPSSSGMGWSKPGNIALKEKEDIQVSETTTKGNGAYMPPSARYGDTVSAHFSNVEKAMVLRGEDFPSLKAALPSSSGPHTAQKHKESSGSGYSQNVKQVVSEEPSNDLRNTSHFNSPATAAPIQSSHRVPNGVNDNPRPRLMDHAQKQDDPLSVIWLNPRSDWADDERDTGRRFTARSDLELPKTETYWDRDFEVPRSSILPHKPPHSHGAKAEPPYNSWRNSSSIYKDRSAINEVVPNHDVLTGQGRQWNVESNRHEKFTSGSVFSKPAFSKSEQTYVDESAGVYDERDPFLAGVLKRKKNVMIEQTSDFHDPVRECFEAELERVQKMQEMERQRIVEEQERVLEQARKEDEERRRAISEEEERRKRMEEEARESAWRAEQERLDAIQKAEEQKIAREEEKRRILLEEERRKQAAKQKLLDLEARMAKRNNAEVGKTDPSMDSDLDNWEVSQRITTSDSSAMDNNSQQPQFSTSMPSPVVNNPWKRDAFDVGGGFSHLEDRDHNNSRWSSFGDGRNDSDFYDNVGWEQGHSRLSYPDRFDSDNNNKLYSFGRSRYSMKQPRVLPPPSLSSLPRSSLRGENELSAPSSSLESTARTGGGSGGPLQQSQENVTLRCDSQSSLSVSSPPSSPTHLSHDELDDDTHIGGEVNIDDEPVGEEVTTSKFVSKDEDEYEDEDWNHDELQEQEVYDEEDDGYGEEDEVLLEGPDDDLTQEFEHLQIEEKSNNEDVIENLVLGFNEGVEVRISPGDEFEKDSDGNNPQVGVSVEEQVIHENASYISTSLGDQVSSSAVPLQFGLFSRPTLIPSPVPAIQIGSIQMPLPLHPPVVAAAASSQPPLPLFQFGQLVYPSPMTQQQLSLLHHPNITHFHSETLLPNHHFSQEISKKDTGSVIAFKPVIQSEEKAHATINNDSQPQPAPASSSSNRVFSAGKSAPLSKAPGPLNRGKRNVYPARNSLFQAYESNDFQRKHHHHRRLIQRTEFRVRENFNSDTVLDDSRLNINKTARSGYRRQTTTTSLKRVVHEPAIISSESISRETARTKASSSVEKRNVPEEDVDAPLQSGVVRVFNQPGIECLSDEDDFIEVRSKRQMLNDRREQREKEIKAKSRASTKQPRKAIISSSVYKNKTFTALSAGETLNNIRSDAAGVAIKEQTVAFSTVASPQPIGTATVGTDVHISKPHQVGSSAAEDHGMFETENKVVDDVQTTLGGWNDARPDQQVIPLTQIQFDEAMKPSGFNTTTTHVTSIGDQTTLDNEEPVLPSSSILTMGKSVPSSSSPINSLLAGEKIQFGAVTSPAILPPTTRVVTHAVGPHGSFRSDTNQNILNPENDCKAEVEAVVDTKETAGNGLGRVSVSSVDVIQGGLDADQQPGSQSKPEESLSVSLPADLSVETPPMSLWPPLPSPQGSSPQMMSHFPFYDMNHPMMSGPVFAFGRHDETQSQPQKQPTDSRHVGAAAWQNHSGMDPFYGPPAGFPGPFIGAPQASPPHMVVYNHYSPVGQFGQVSLSFMGATYIPSGGKQPDWKHDPTSSSGRSEEDMRQPPRNPPNNNMQPPIQQHLAPGSPLLPMTMFDVPPPFQAAAAPDMSVQARWSHVPASSLHAVPISPPVPHQAEVLTRPQFSSHGGDQSMFPPNRSSEPQAPTPPVVRDSSITHFPDALGLLDSPVSTKSNPGHITKTGEGVESNDLHQQGKNLSSSQQYNIHNNNYNHHHHGGYGYQRVSPKSKLTGGQWSSNPRTGAGFHGRSEKSFPSSTKVKQIYVVKQAGGSSSRVG